MIYHLMLNILNLDYLLMIQIYLLLLIKDRKIDMNEVNIQFLEVQKMCFVNKLTINLKKTNTMLIKGEMAIM